MPTGDITATDDDGYFTIVSRKTDMILTAGCNVYSAKVERVLCSIRQLHQPLSPASPTMRRAR